MSFALKKYSQWGFLISLLPLLISGRGDGEDLNGCRSEARVTLHDVKNYKQGKEMSEDCLSCCNVEYVRELEKRIQTLEKKATKQYPKVRRLPFENRKRILVTGGAGFVGSHLVDKLMYLGHEVIVADNFFTGRKSNVEQWSGHENFELLNHDVTLPLFIEVDQIYHLASPASPVHYTYNPVKTIKSNTIGTINMLGLAKRAKATILLASTSEVYGDPQVHPQPESYWGHVNPIGSRACYDESKRVAEALVYAYAQKENVSVRVARIFNTFGPRMQLHDGRAVSNFIIQALLNESLSVHGTGQQTRSFMYISDLVPGLIALMESNYTHPVNLGNPDERTILNLAETILATIKHTKSTVKHYPALADDPQHRQPDISTAKKELKWQPKVNLPDVRWASISGLPTVK